MPEIGFIYNHVYIIYIYVYIMQKYEILYLSILKNIQCKLNVMCIQKCVYIMYISCILYLSNLLNIQCKLNVMYIQKYFMFFVYKKSLLNMLYI